MKHEKNTTKDYPKNRCRDDDVIHVTPHKFNAPKSKYTTTLFITLHVCHVYIKLLSQQQNICT